MYSNIEYRFHTGLMYDTEKKLPDGREIMYGLYRKNSFGEEREYELLGEYANMQEVLESTVIDNRCFKEIIMDADTELMGQDEFNYQNRLEISLRCKRVCNSV